MTKKNSSAGVYLLYGWYVGQTTDFGRRYPREVRDKLSAWVDVPEEDLDEVEKEAIEFCRAFGLPLANINHNGGHTAHGSPHRKSKYEAE